MKEIKLTLCNAELNAELNDWMQKYAENAKWKSGWDNTEWGIVSEKHSFNHHEYWYRNLYDTEDNIIDCPGGTVYLTDESARNIWGEGYELT